MRSLKELYELYSPADDQVEEILNSIETKTINAIKSGNSVFYYHLGYSYPSDVEDRVKSILIEKGFEISYIDPVDNVLHISIK